MEMIRMSHHIPPRRNVAFAAQTQIPATLPTREQMGSSTFSLLKIQKTRVPAENRSISTQGVAMSLMGKRVSVWGLSNSVTASFSPGNHM